jgi:hypothetical protein
VQGLHDVPDLGVIARCQVHASAAERCLPPPVFNSIIPLTRDNSTCQVLLNDLMQHGILNSDTKDINEKIAVLMNEWPQVAENRVLNNSFSALDYMNLPLIPSPVATQTDSNHNELTLVLGLIFMGYLINSARKLMTSAQRSKFFNIISDYIYTSTINPQAAKQTVPLLGKQNH